MTVQEKRYSCEEIRRMPKNTWYVISRALEIGAYRMLGIEYDQWAGHYFEQETGDLVIRYA